MKQKFDVAAIVEDLFWGSLSILGMLASVGLIALVFRLSLGKW